MECNQTFVVEFLGVTLEFPDFPVGSISFGNKSQILEYRVV